jgi:hypothetical protein
MIVASSGTGYDLVATFDCLHDKGDPVHRRDCRPPPAAARRRTWVDVPLVLL